MASPVPFWRSGLSRAYSVPAIANKAAPTAAELAAGTRLDEAIITIAGFTFTNQPISSRTMNSTVSKQTPGEDQLAASSMTFLEDKTTNPIIAALAKGQVTNIVLFYAGIAGANPAAADKCEVWPAASAGFHRTNWTETNAAAYEVGMSIVDTPVQNAVLA